jgi:hypothetical protein
MEFRASGGNAATQVVVADGGVSVSSLYDLHYNSTACPTDGTGIRLLSQKIASGRDALGYRGAFQLINPVQDDYALLKSDYLGGGAVDLKWKYLPGVGGEAVKAADIYVHRHSGGDTSHQDGKDDEYPCNITLAKKGFQLIQAGVQGSSYIHSSGSTPFGVIDDSNYYNFSFAVCPYFEAGGTKIYYRELAQSSCFGGCDNMFSFGQGVSSSTMSGDTFASNGTGGYARVVNVDTSNPDYNLVKLRSPVGSLTGNGTNKEVIFLVMAEGNGFNSCGSHQGHNINPGQLTKTQILSNTYSSPNYYIKVPKGSYLDSMSTAENSALSLDEYDPMAAFCWLQAVQVPHFKTLTVGPSGYFAPAFSFVGGGGIVAFRAEKLNLGGPISAFGKGFPGGSNMDADYGAGIGGINNPYGSTHNGGAPGVSSSTGGGSFGKGGDVVIGDTGGASWASLTGNSYLQLVMGGGSGSTGSGPHYEGLAGAGIIFVAAQTTTVTSSTNAHLDASGKTDSSGGPYAGGSGGGSIAFVTRLLNDTASGTYDFKIHASGGDGAYADGASPAVSGPGGGGYISAGICSAAISYTSINLAGSLGTATGDATPAEDGNSMSNDQSWMCHSDY